MFQISKVSSTRWQRYQIRKCNFVAKRLNVKQFLHLTFFCFSFVYFPSVLAQNLKKKGLLSYFQISLMQRWQCPFTTVPLKPLYDQKYKIYRRLSINSKSVLFCELSMEALLLGLWRLCIKVHLNLR